MMKWRKTVYVWHRWIALVVSVQLLAWSVGGLMFSILDIDNVHGDLERNTDPPSPIRADDVSIPPPEVLTRAATAGFDAADVTSLVLRTRWDGRVVYELRNRKNTPLAAVDANTGDLMRPIRSGEAKEAALADFAPGADVRSVRLIEDDAPLEYRGKPLPVYQVILDHPKEPHLYISPITGDVVTRRNRPWRIFDFFWMLHIMDYRQRDDFNHLLLTSASVLAVLTSASGLVLWAYRLPRIRRRTPARRG